MLLTGDAACFIDPVFSTGVHLATYGGLLAARSINSVLDGELDVATVMAEFEGRYRREYGAFYEFLTAYHDMEQREDSYFWEARTVTSFGETDLEASHDLATAVAATGAMQTESGEKMTHLFGAPVVADVMVEMNQIQTRGVIGEGVRESPVLPGGLVPSVDGLGWALQI